MVLKEEVFKTEDGKVELKAKQLSFAAQMRFEAKGKEKNLLDVYKECVDKPELLEQLNVEEGLKLAKLINQLNGWDKKIEEQKEDFSQPTQESGK